MPILNVSYVFERDAPPDAHAAFSSHPKKTLFNTGVEFRRFITAENRRTGERGNLIFGSPWWFTKETFQGLIARSDPRGLGIGDVARIDLAVSKEFNAKMEWICVIYLTQSVYGWSGKAARQLATGRANIYFGVARNKSFFPISLPIPRRPRANMRECAFSACARIISKWRKYPARKRSCL